MDWICFLMMSAKECNGLSSCSRESECRHYHLIFWSFGLLHTFSFYGSFSSNFSPLTDEPVWAIGTGKVATPETAQNVHAACRSIIADIYDQEAADNMRILYGGSVTPESVDELMAQPDIDGCLVGGASLDSAKFGRIINFQS